MQREFWHERWQLNQIGFHSEEINLHLQQYWPILNIASGSRVFVPLCGKSKDMLWLLTQGNEVIGVELSQLAVEAFFTENGLSATTSQQGKFSVSEADGLRIYCGDFFDLTANDLAGVGPSTTAPRSLHCRRKCELLMLSTCSLCSNQKRKRCWWLSTIPSMKCRDRLSV